MDGPGAGSVFPQALLRIDAEMQLRLDTPSGGSDRRSLNRGEALSAVVSPAVDIWHTCAVATVTDEPRRGSVPS